MFTCKACKYGEYPVKTILDNTENQCRCRHSEIENLQFSTIDQYKMIPKDWAKIDFLMRVLLKLKINEKIPADHLNFAFPFRYDPVWIEGCDGFEKK